MSSAFEAPRHPCYAVAPPAANRYCDGVPHSLPISGVM
jgi:hypothetical protein